MTKAAPVEPPITFRPLAEGDLPMLLGWLERPHVAAWWQPTPSYDELVAEYRPCLVPPGTRPQEAPGGLVPFLALEAGEPFAFVQAYHVVASQADGWWLDERDPGALGTDQFLADEARLGQGLGTRMLRAFLAHLFEDPRVTSVQVDPAPENARAIAAYRKAGFRDLGLVETPDGPARLMRINRAAWEAPVGQQLALGEHQGRHRSRTRQGS